MLIYHLLVLVYHAVVKSSILSNDETTVLLKKPVDFWKSSKILVKTFDESNFITEHDKHRKKLKRTNSDKITKELYFYNIAKLILNWNKSDKN